MQDHGASSYRRYLQGEKQALEELVASYSDALVRYACCYIHDYAAAEDIAEDAFVALILKRKHFSCGEQLRAYLFKTVRNKCYDHLRKRQRITSLEEWFLPPQETERILALRERDAALYAALRSLQGDYRDALYLVYIEGFSAEECGAIMHKSKKQIYNLLARAKTALRERLIKEGFRYEIL